MKRSHLPEVPPELAPLVQVGPKASPFDLSAALFVRSSYVIGTI
jgi:hypothetical protein